MDTQTKAATTIQRWVRNIIAKCVANKAATTIQHCVCDIVANKAATTIQRWVRNIISPLLIGLINSKYQTKNWRKNQKWYKGGKQNECEKYQLEKLQCLMKATISKTNIRIHILDFELVDQSRIDHATKFELTENFDGLIHHGDLDIFFNLKFVCEKGGAQTRTLKLVYYFMIAQCEYLLKHDSMYGTYFMNILDGDVSHNTLDCFQQLLNKPIYKKIKSQIFVGDLYTFSRYWTSHLRDRRISGKQD